MERETEEKILKFVSLDYTNNEIIDLLAKDGEEVTRTQVWRVRQKYNNDIGLQEQVEKKMQRNDWFSREFRAQKAAEIAELLYNDIMSGKQFAEEVSEGKFGEVVKPVYFAGLVKNWNDTVKTIAESLGQNKDQKEITIKREESLSLLISKIYDADEEVTKKFEEAEIIDLPPNENDFSDEKEFAELVKKQNEEHNIPSMDELGDMDESFG